MGKLKSVLFSVIDKQLLKEAQKNKTSYTKKYEELLKKKKQLLDNPSHGASGSW